MTIIFFIHIIQKVTSYAKRKIFFWFTLTMLEYVPGIRINQESKINLLSLGYILSKNAESFVYLLSIFGFYQLV